jgi:hypothetical protein
VRDPTIHQYQAKFRESCFFASGGTVGSLQDLFMPPSMHSYLFNHIPKTGGTTLRKALAEWFEVVDDYAVGWNPSRKPKDPVRFGDLGQNQIVMGHYCTPGRFLDERYPGIFGDPSIRLISVVREPLELSISHYRFVVRKGKNEDNLSLEEHILRHRNIQARFLNCTGANLEERLSDYYFIGCQELLQDSFDLLAEDLGKPPLKLSEYSRNIAPSCEPKPEVEPKVLEQYLEQNSIDYALHRKVRKKIEARLNQPKFKGDA